MKSGPRKFSGFTRCSQKQKSSGSRTLDGATVWAELFILDIVMLLNDVQRLTVCGLTENGRRVELLTTGDVARALNVSQTLVTKWDASGLLKAAFRSPGGHRRYRLADVARFRDTLPARAWQEDVSTEEITTLRETQHLSWKAIGEKFGMTSEGVRRRYYRTRRESQSQTPPTTG